MVGQAALQSEVAKLLSGADLNSITSKKVRIELERRLGVDLSDRKSEIDSAIQAVLESASNNSNTSSSGISDSGGKEKSTKRIKNQSQQKPSKYDGENGSDDDTDSSLSELDDDTPAAKKPKSSSDAKQKETVVFKKSAKQPELSDEELARQLHLKENGLPRRRAAAAAASSSSASSAKKKQRKSTGGGGGGGGFSKPCILSPALASVVGCDSMPRQQVVKRLWELAKERNLFDPKNKQFVICDAQFEKLFNKKRLRMFALMKYLKNHVWNEGD